MCTRPKRLFPNRGQGVKEEGAVNAAGHCYQKGAQSDVGTKQAEAGKPRLVPAGRVQHFEERIDADDDNEQHRRYLGLQRLSDKLHYDKGGYETDKPVSGEDIGGAVTPPARNFI